jgi:hypothetical protein
VNTNCTSTNSALEQATVPQMGKAPGITGVIFDSLQGNGVVSIDAAGRSLVNPALDVSIKGDGPAADTR